MVRMGCKAFSGNLRNASHSALKDVWCTRLMPRTLGARRCTLFREKFKFLTSRM